MDSNQITYPVTFTLRRGLSTILSEVNETPHAGEPIIETDTLKIKIGDGEHAYNELEYVDAKEFEALQAKLDNADLDRAAIRDDFAAEDQRWSASAASAREEIWNYVKTIENKINALPANELEVVKADLAAHKEEATTNFTNINGKLDSATSDRATIKAEFAAADLKVTTSLNEEIARATAAEADALSQSKAYTDSVKTAILGSEQLESTFNTLTNIAAWIEGDGVNATELTEAIAIETQNRATEDTAIRQSIIDLNTTINATINDLDIAHKAEIKSTNDTIAALGTELRGVDSNINTRLDAAIAAHEAEDARIDAAYKAADAVLEEALKNYFDTELGVIANGQY
jgi:hypothetical protein